jgi:two-component system sensor kinase
VKNGFAIINGLISLEAKREADPAIQGVLTDMRNRIGAMSKLYDLLNRSFGTDETRLDSYLRQLSDVLYSTYLADHGAVKLELLLDEMHIDTHMAMSIGLIFNELFTNALKYAFRASGHGTIRITLKSVKENGVLEISDDGAGLPENFDIQKSGGLGMEIVRMLAVQIKGKLEVERAARTAFRITFPRVHKA